MIGFSNISGVHEFRRRQTQALLYKLVQTQQVKRSATQRLVQLGMRRTRLGFRVEKCTDSFLKLRC